MATQFTTDTFNQDVLSASGLVIVDFWAEWCGPCRTLGPIIEELSNANSDESVKIGKLNVDEHGELAQQYNVMSIPTIIFFKDGKEVHRMVGVQSKETLQEKISELK